MMWLMRSVQQLAEEKAYLHVYLDGARSDDNYKNITITFYAPTLPPPIAVVHSLRLTFASPDGLRRHLYHTITASFYNVRKYQAPDT